MCIPGIVGAIFAIFILCVQCDNAAYYNENTKINVPSAPQNLQVNRVTADEIHLSWAPPLPSHEAQTRAHSSAPHGTRTHHYGPPAGSMDGTSVQADGPNTDYTYEHIDSPNDDIKPLLDEHFTSKRETRRRRKRRHGSDGTNLDRSGMENPEPNDIRTVEKKGNSQLNSTQIAYVLYYEQGVLKSYFTIVNNGTQISSDVREKSLFLSDLVKDQQKSTRNVTLLNTSKHQTKVVGFRLRNLRPFTPYKIWVRAFYNFSLEGVKSSDLIDRLGPPSAELYVLTDVRPPSSPVIQNLTCDQHKGILTVQWHQPHEYNNSIDQYIVTIRRVPETEPRSRLILPANKTDIDTTIDVNVVDLSNATYAVQVAAGTQSVAQKRHTVIGAWSKPEEISSDSCSAHSAAMSPADVRSSQMKSMGTTALLAILPLALLAAVSVALVYWRCRSRLSKCISAAYNFLEEGGERAARAPLNAYKKPVNCSPLVSCGGGAGGADPSPAASPGWRPPRMAGPAHPAVPRRAFPAHVAALHADGDIGFSKEYEIVVSKSAALGHTSHHSHRPENRLKNRYLNITAYDHSRVCVSAGGRCGAAGCVGGAGAGTGKGREPCDYVNANFIDGMLPHLTPRAIARIRRKLAPKPLRQPSVKPTKPPPNLAEGIESAFLNIEFSGIVESEQNDSDSDASDDDVELDDVYVDIDGVKTRVKLEWLIWRRRYIATQGPTPATIDAFWRMIWQHRVHTVVMITNLVERGRRKCDMYWPDGGRGSSAEFGGLRITLENEDVRAMYTVRQLRVVNLEKRDSQTDSRDSESGSPASSGSAEDGRLVTQYHYTVWPDHGTPRHPLAVLPFVKAASADKGTVLVHCSAGVGRTGTYIVLDAQLNQLRLTGTLSPLGFLCRARTQRNHLVQTEEQYIFVHDALLEHVRSGNTEFELSKAREYLAKILQPISEEELAVLDLTSPKPKSVHDLSNGTANGLDNCETASVVTHNSEKEVLENGSELSIKTEDLNSERSKSVEDLEAGDPPGAEGSPRGAGGDARGPNGDIAEGVYDLAPRSTDTFSKKMAAYNNLTDQEKEEIRRVNRAENYALLERMRSLATRHHTYQGPPPVNLLEKQFLLVTRSCAEASVNARASHNAGKNRPGGVLPTDCGRVLLLPKPGVEGSEYVNASWVCGRRRLREYAVAQHPPRAVAGDLWRLLWDHTSQLVLVLSDDDPDCEVFWPTEDEPELFIANFKASFVSKETYVAHRKSERKSPVPTPPEPETNGLRRQESDCADDERLIPENSPVLDAEPYRLDRTELRLERLGSGRDMSTRKSIANADLFSSLSEKRNGPKSPKSPSKMSLKNFKLSSPTKFKLPEWGAKTAGSPPDMAPPPPPVAPALSVEEEIELCRPFYYFEKVENAPESISPDRVIEVTNVSVHALQDDYQLSVKFIKCSNWLEGHTTDYTPGKPDENEYIRAVREAASASERQDAIDRLIEPYKDSFGLIEYVAGSQMEYKNGPVVVVDKYGGWKAMTFCTLSAACGGTGGAGDLYCWAALGAGARAGAEQRPHAHTALLRAYCAAAALHQDHR